MSDTQPFALLVLLVAVVGVIAILSNHLTTWVKVPTPVVFLVAAAGAVKLFPSLHVPPEQTVSRVVSIALVFILFDGGMHIGWSRFRSAAAPIGVLGVAGTFLTVVVGGALVHLAFGLDWYVSFLVATAVASTDPAVVFSVLAQREVLGRSGTILEGESGANDPVGIALMTSLVAGGAFSGAALGHTGTEFLLQMGVGGAVGILGGASLGWFIRRVPLPSEGLYPLRTAASVLIVFAVGTLAHGSGFLAVFVAGIMLGDQAAPYKREIERFHSALASLAEIVAFVVLHLHSSSGRWLSVFVYGRLASPTMSVISCSLPGSKGPCLFCWGATFSVPTYLMSHGSMASWLSWWFSRWSSKGAWYRRWPGCFGFQCAQSNWNRGP
jgi:cell volume regulation protein A